MADKGIGVIEYIILGALHSLHIILCFHTRMTSPFSIDLGSWAAE